MPTSIDNCVIQLDDYRAAIQLDMPVSIESDSEWSTLVDPVLVKFGLNHDGLMSIEEKMESLIGVLATIDPYQIPGPVIKDIETIARRRTLEAGVVDVGSIATPFDLMGLAGHSTTHLVLWTGDITRLGVDAIVNAANNLLLGCRFPNHHCIDNAIHSAAGPRLRDDCATIMSLQNSPEPTGVAKITRGYALPARFVLHTVGPIIRHGEMPTTAERELLQSAYHSCLDVAASVDTIQTLALCAISTGEYAFPKREAAIIAMSAVSDWIASNPTRFRQIIFCVYTDEDANIYDAAISEVR